MTHFLNAFAAIASFGTYSLLALWQTAGITDLTILKDVGMGGAFIITCIFMFRYFTEQNNKKDETIKELTQKFVDITKQFAETATSNKNLLDEILRKLHED